MDERTHIATCVKALSEKCHLDPAMMQERDFEFVSQKVREATKVELSTATLRRIWAGKYLKTPQIKTLDALSQTLGYQGWHFFKIHQAQPSKPKRLTIRKQYLWLLVLPFLVGFVWSYSQLKPLPTEEFLFRPETNIRQGVPATVGFNYDIQKIAGEVSIQLSWIPDERAILDPEKHFYTGTYFYPDFHEARLLKGDEELALSKVHITTDKWHGLIMREGLDPNPVLLDHNDFLDGTVMKVSADLAKTKGVIQQVPFFPVFTLSNETLDSLSADELSLQFNVSLLPVNPSQNCRAINILVKGTNNRMRIPISMEGCYGLYNLYVGDRKISGKTTDLSSLSADLSKQIPISIKTANQILTVSVDNQEPISVEYPGPLGSLKVIKFTTTGPATIDAVRFGTNKEGPTF